MSADTRTRLATLVRRPEADLAEAALLIAAEAHPDLDVDASLLRIDAFADSLLSAGRLPEDDEEAELVADALAFHLGRELGFAGHADGERDPDDALLDEVLRRRRGLPVTLTVLWVAVARRLRLRVFPIALPGHVVAGIDGGDRIVVVDPFAGGRILGERELADLVRIGTGGQAEFTRAMLRPSSPPAVVRRILNNLTRDYTTAGRLTDALWTVELKQLLPAAPVDDHRARGELLFHLGRYRDAADAFEAYVEDAPGDAPDLAEISRMAIRARAKLN
ncbi:MAG: transglutaminase-like domain-containing protein [Actinobacteria bacterium]|nr:transglutaminase-like domain-containing protein [Actinomycetota bacterium]